jgi:hypothetical protein
MNSKYEYESNERTTLPQNVGTNFNLPDEIRDIAGIHAATNVVAWTTFDEEFDHTLDPSMLRCRLVKLGLLIPCICPFMVLMSPCIPSLIIDKVHSIRHTYWILTDRDVKIVVQAIESCCDGRWNHTQSISLKDITDCRITEHSPPGGCCSLLKNGLPFLYIDTVASRSKEQPTHEAVGKGLVGYSRFRTEILYRRDLVLGSPTVPTMAEATIAVAEPETRMDRGTTISSESVIRRMQIITDLHQRGIMTKAEYEMKRHEIFALI